MRTAQKRIELGEAHLYSIKRPAYCNVLRTGCQWKALDATGICSGSTAHLRFQEWVAAGVFLELGRVGLERYDELKGLDWSWLSMDGAMTKSPLGGGKNRPQPH